MRGKKRFLLLAALLPLSLLTRANGENGDRRSEPILQGNVADAATKKPVQGVTVFISTPKGLDKKEFTTDASGNFKVPQMPVGEVIIILEKKGYKTTRREGVIIREGVSLKMNFDLNSVTEDESDVFHPFLHMMEG